MSDTAKSQALAKIEQGLKEYKGNQYGNAMKHYVADILMDFCRQQEEFARAVVDGGTFGACMEAVCKAVKGNVLSDLDACKTAAAFYFPGCVIDFKMEIRMSSYETEVPQAGGISLNLEDFL